MLKLKKLQILGFKSFCDRTELKFHGEGIAAIVGPNGCGKSNISDAITWVLGEQSAKSLRGARMEDVIFNGTRDRKPTGMAEVSLTLIDPDVYPGGDIAEPEIEIRDEMPTDDWDEAEIRAHNEKDVDEYIEEVRPGQREEIPVHGAPETAAQSAEQSAEAAPAPEANAAHAAPQGVVLKIRRRKFKQNEFRKGQITVTRRLFRTGDSEYLMNGKLCRLRDIQELFMGTGLGPESYAIIAQERISQILSSKPHDRRAIIEEAAGVSKYKTKKRLAEARLEESKLNLARVNDIFDEVQRQMNSLKRQAAKAERYAKLRDEMREKLRVVLASKFAESTAQGEQLQAELHRITEDLRVRGEVVAEREIEHEERVRRGYAIETEIRRTGERLNQIALEADRAGARQRTNDERCAELLARGDESRQELERTSAQLATLNSEVEANRAVLESAAADVAAAQAEAAASQQEAMYAANALTEVEQQQELRRSQVMEAVAASSEVRNQITQAQEHMAALDREAARLSREAGVAAEEIEGFTQRHSTVAAEHQRALENVLLLTAEINGLRAQLDSRRAEEADCKRHLDSLRAEFATALGKRNSLESVIAEHGYSTESVKRLFQSGAIERGFAPVGVLADFLEVEDQYESVVEDFLRDELNYIVVKSWDAADEGLRMLQTDVDGRATFLVHPNDSQAKFSFVLDQNAHRAPERPQPIVPVKDCIRVLNGFGKSLEVILPKLRDGFITPDAGLARELALENPDAFFLAPTGESFHNVTVTGGKQRSEGPLSMKRELREVQRQIADLEAALRNEERRLAEITNDILSLSAKLEELEAEKRSSEIAALTAGHAVQQLESELARSRERLGLHQRELGRVAAEQSAKKMIITDKQAALALHEQRRAELEALVVATQERLASLRGARDSAVQTASEMSARVAGLEERRRAAHSALQRIEAMVAEIAARVQALEAHIAAAAAEKQQRAAENVALAEQIVALAAEREVTQQQAVQFQVESEQVRARLGQIEAELKAARHELDAARDRRGDLSATLAKLTSDREYMEQTCMNELGVDAQQLRSDSAIVLLSGEQLGLEDGAYRELRMRLDNMGPVNMMALEEYKETAQRFDFLEGQRKDLLDSIENTQNTIRELDVISRQKFDEAFARINENFQMTFRKLFGGGQAFMRLTDEENSTESGIDVVASPPGKKLQNVLLLSGGEKALTALSLLVGIFQYQPSPFCILDEVDAPLDEANVGRFTELVREMSVQTQFVLITHNKRTMSMAPVMYGVTMQEPGVSKLVSVRFGQHEEPRAATA